MEVPIGMSFLRKLPNEMLLVCSPDSVSLTTVSAAARTDLASLFRNCLIVVPLPRLPNKAHFTPLRHTGFLEVGGGIEG
jgi:hypothetical protein